MTVPTRNMDHRGLHKVDGVPYRLIPQTAVVAKPLSSCSGCVARLNEKLCTRLPDSCIPSRSIWIIQQ